MAPAFSTLSIFLLLNLDLDYTLFVLPLPPLSPPPPNHLRKGRKGFKFDSKWTIEPDCRGVIEEGWRCNRQGSDPFKMVHKLKMCRLMLSNWGKQQANISREKVAQALVTLNELHEKPYITKVREEEQEVTRIIEHRWN